LLGVVSALFSFIPYFGNFMGATIPFVFALLTEDSTTYAIRVVVFAFIVHFFENNILSPNIVGNQVRINPFIIILGLIMGAMIWGIPGMLVAIPFLAIVNTVLKKIPGMQAYVFLLGPRGTRRHGITFENTRKYFETVRKRWNRMRGRNNPNNE
jgi:predicted PurR-regulated permease PerM